MHHNDFWKNMNEVMTKQVVLKIDYDILPCPSLLSLIFSQTLLLMHTHSVYLSLYLKNQFLFLSFSFAFTLCIFLCLNLNMSISISLPHSICLSLYTSPISHSIHIFFFNFLPNLCASVYPLQFQSFFSSSIFRCFLFFILNFVVLFHRFLFSDAFVLFTLFYFFPIFLNRALFLPRSKECYR